MYQGWNFSIRQGQGHYIYEHGLYKVHVRVLSPPRYATNSDNHFQRHAYVMKFEFLLEDGVVVSMREILAFLAAKL